MRVPLACVSLLARQPFNRSESVAPSSSPFCRSHDVLVTLRSGPEMLKPNGMFRMPSRLDLISFYRKAHTYLCTGSLVRAPEWSVRFVAVSFPDTCALSTEHRAPSTELDWMDLIDEPTWLVPCPSSTTSTSLGPTYKGPTRKPPFRLSCPLLLPSHKSVVKSSGVMAC
jgi:hypothetical protein